MATRSAPPCAAGYTPLRLRLRRYQEGSGQVGARNNPKATNGSVSATGTFREARRLARTYRRYAPFYDWLFASLYRSARTRSIASLRLATSDRLFIACIGTGLDLLEIGRASCRERVCVPV